MRENPVNLFRKCALTKTALKTNNNLEQIETFISFINHTYNEHFFPQDQLLYCSVRVRWLWAVVDGRSASLLEYPRP